MRLHLLPLATLAAALSLSACAPRALYFHESTKVAFAADYNTSDSQPLSSSFGYKRRIVAVVPAQEREIPDGGTERNATNSGEALSLVSKFNVRSGAKEGVVITNNFASGMAARAMTRSAGSSDALSVLMHSAPIPVSTTDGRTIEENKPAADVVNERLSRIMGKRTREVPGSRRSTDLDERGNATFKKRQPDVPPSSRVIDLDEDGNIKSSGQPGATGGKKTTPKPDPLPKKADVPASTRSVDLTPDGGAEIKKR
jgi:hypothetical protein